MAIFTGAAVALITPMHSDGSLNFDKMGELIDYQIENGTDAFVICGTTGEPSTMTHEEHIETIRFAVSHINKRVPVIAGASSNCTATEVYLSEESKKAGADALLLVSPYYNKATQNGLYEHFGAAARAVDLPIILYNIPGRTGVNIQPATVKRLIDDFDNIVGMKDATGNIDQTMRTMALCEGKLDLYSGNDDQITPILGAGGKGVISVLSHVAPRDTHNIVEWFLNGRVQDAIALQHKYSDLVKALFSEVNPIPVKKALNLMGMNVGPLRLPLTEMEPANAAVLEAEMRKLGIIK